MMNTKQLVAGVMVALALSACGSDGGTTNPGGVASVRLNATSLTMLPGAEDALAATALDASGNPIASAPSATWTSASAAVATVTAAGLVRAVGVGQTDVTATISGKSASARITVGQAPLTARVDMPGNTFSPFTSVIRRTGVVTFVFGTVAHNVIFKAATGVPADILVTANAQVTRTFNTVGEFAYDCTLHDGMKGDVKVVP